MRFLRDNRDLMRLAFATAFATPGELRLETRAREKRSRNFKFMNHCLFSLVAGVALLLGPTGCKKAGASGPGGMPPIQVIAVEAKRQPVTESLPLIGSLAADEMVEIKAEVEGVVQEILFTEGQRVEKGQLLIRLDETKFATALAEAESNFKLSQANFERARQLFKEKLISQQEYDQVSATFDVNQAALDRRKRELKDARIYAPFAGIMGARMISPGQVITRNAILSCLVDLDPIKVELDVPERFLSQVQVGQTLDLKVAAYPTNRFEGKVYFVAPSVNPDTRTTLVKAQIPNPNHELKPGQQPPGQVKKVSGLEAGEKVVVEGVQKIGPGAKVTLAPAQAAAPYLK